MQNQYFIVNKAINIFHIRAGEWYPQKFARTATAYEGVRKGLPKRNFQRSMEKRRASFDTQAKAVISSI